jgi:hypothetical protein
MVHFQGIGGAVMAESLCYSCGKYKLCTLRLQAKQPVTQCGLHGSDTKKKKGKRGK